MVSITTDFIVRLVLIKMCNVKSSVINYDLPGCVDGCVHKLLDTQRVQDYGCVNVYGGYHGHLITTEIVPHCAMETERALFRKQVFEAAQEALDHVGKHYASFSGRMMAERKAWNAESRKWWDGPCPFYKPIEDNDG